MFVKICGLTTPEAVRVAAEAGADAVGFVFSASTRRVTVEQAAALAREAPPGLLCVAVYQHPERSLVARVAVGLPDARHQSDALDFGDAFEGAVAPARFWPVVRDGAGVRRRFDEAAARFGGAGGDASSEPPTIVVEGPRSGAGVTPDWGRIAPLAAGARVILAGGLTPDNVGQAIGAVGPFGVDVSSGVESSPGVKDLGLIRAFVEAARSAG